MKLLKLFTIGSMFFNIEPSSKLLSNSGEAQPDLNKITPSISPYSNKPSYYGFFDAVGNLNINNNNENNKYYNFPLEMRE